MNFNNINKEIIAGVATVLVVCVVVTSVPWSFSSGASEENVTTEFFNIQTSAGANASISASENSTVAGAAGAVSGGTVGIVDVDNNLVGQPSDEETTEEVENTEDVDNTEDVENSEDAKVEYNTYGYTNLGLAVVDGNLNVRKKASTSSSVVGKLTNYAACEILEELDGWYKITSGNVEGYVSSEYVITGEEALIIAQIEARNIATVTTDALRVRSAPTTDSKKLSTISKGEELVVLEVLDGWVRVEFDGYEEAYISTDYVTVEMKLKTGNTMDELRYDSGVSKTRIDLVNYALQFVGTRYVWGGNSLTKGVDCSGFTKQIYKKFGITLPRTSYTQPKVGKKIKASQAQPGDLFFYGDSSGINHVAIYIGNGKIVHASNPSDGVKISNAYYRTPKCVVSYLD